MLLSFSPTGPLDSGKGPISCRCLMWLSAACVVGNWSSAREGYKGYRPPERRRPRHVAQPGLPGYSAGGNPSAVGWALWIVGLWLALYTQHRETAVGGGQHPPKSPTGSPPRACRACRSTLRARLAAPVGNLEGENRSRRGAAGPADSVLAVVFSGNNLSSAARRGGLPGARQLPG